MASNFSFGSDRPFQGFLQQGPVSENLSTLPERVP